MPGGGRGATASQPPNPRNTMPLRINTRRARVIVSSPVSDAGAERSGVADQLDVAVPHDLAVADEEAGGMFGAGWLVEERPEIFDGVGFLLNEGGGGTQVGDAVEFGVEVTQKVPYWLHLRTVGEPPRFEFEPIAAASIGPSAPNQAMSVAA